MLTSQGKVNIVLQVRVRKAKNDQKAKGHSTFVEAPVGGTITAVMETWRTICLHPDPEKPLIQNTNNGRRLSVDTIRKEIKQALRAAGNYQTSVSR